MPLLFFWTAASARCRLVPDSGVGLAEEEELWLPLARRRERRRRVVTTALENLDENLVFPFFVGFEDPSLSVEEQ